MKPKTLLNLHYVCFEICSMCLWFHRHKSYIISQTPPRVIGIKIFSRFVISLPYAISCDNNNIIKPNFLYNFEFLHYASNIHTFIIILLEESKIVTVHRTLNEVIMATDRLFHFLAVNKRLREFIINNNNTFSVDFVLTRSLEIKFSA